MKYKCVRCYFRWSKILISASRQKISSSGMTQCLDSGTSLLASQHRCSPETNNSSTFKTHGSTAASSKCQSAFPLFQASQTPQQIETIVSQAQAKFEKVSNLLSTGFWIWPNKYMTNNRSSINKSCRNVSSAINSLKRDYFKS